ncbi:hypothetical protein [Halomonas elongata]|uniref:hypothetical protein n=1 Tax=Halomonas elongata TaxID=2746 RepID=UPI0023AF923E|nr:hypothetical protein [Halomonas elongata]
MASYRRDGGAPMMAQAHEVEGETHGPAVVSFDWGAADTLAALDVTVLEEALAAEGDEAIAVTVLSPALWYLSGDGLQSVRTQVEEVVGSLSAR